MFWYFTVLETDNWLCLSKFCFENIVFAKYFCNEAYELKSFFFLILRFSNYESMESWRCFN
jgi:hypothetical protein